MLSFEIALVFIIGLIIGSFTNVLIDRIPAGKFNSNSRSYCQSCKKVLKWYDLFPVLSYLILQGKCRFCDARISNRLVFVELLTGICFAGIYAYTGTYSIPLLLFLATLFPILLALFFIDINHRIIPDSLLLAITLTTLLYLGFAGSDLRIHVITAIISFLFFLFLYAITNGRGIGFGDVKFAGVIGLLLGFPGALIAFYAAFLTGAVVSIILIVSGRKKARGSVIAFGPFLIIGIAIAALFTHEIINFLF